MVVLRAAAVGLVLLACSDPPTRAPLASLDCEGPGCGRGIIGAAPPVGGSGGAPVGGSADAGARILEGEVGIFTDALFFSMRPFVGTGIIGATWAGGRVSAPFDGAAYQLSGVPSTPGVWLDLEPASGDADALPTLHGLDVTRTAVDLAFASRPVFETLLADLATPRTLSTDDAYIVLTFVDGSGNAASGVTVSEPAGRAIAYDDGPVFTEGVGETQSRGTALLVGVPASGFPGALLSVRYASPTRALDGSLAVQAARGAVTFFRVAL